ncbi:unnamed protein product [Ixodes pacificus]
MDLVQDAALFLALLRELNRAHRARQPPERHVGQAALQEQPQRVGLYRHVSQRRQAVEQPLESRCGDPQVCEGFWASQLQLLQPLEGQVARERAQEATAGLEASKPHDHQFRTSHQKALELVVGQDVQFQSVQLRKGAPGHEPLRGVAGGDRESAESGGAHGNRGEVDSQEAFEGERSQAELVEEVVAEAHVPYGAGLCPHGERGNLVEVHDGVDCRQRCSVDLGKTHLQVAQDRVPLGGHGDYLLGGWHVCSRQARTEDQALPGAQLTPPHVEHPQDLRRQRGHLLQVCLQFCQLSRR